MTKLDQLMGLGGSRRVVMATKCVLLHMIVCGGLFLMPVGCTPPPEGAILTVLKSGQGEVDRNPDSVSYSLDTEVTLTATPAAGWAFDRWEGALTGTANPATITMDKNKTVTAVFTELLVLTEWTETDIDADTTIPAGNYLVNDDIYVQNGATLTIAPGTTLRFATGTYLYVASDGALHAAGTAVAPIVLTGQDETPGYWIGVEFVNSNSTDNVLEYVTIKYGGSNYGGITANLYVGGTSRVTINHCTLSHSDGVGFWFTGNSNITFASNTITDNTEGAGQVEPWLVQVLTTTSTYTGNDTDLLRVRGGSTTVDQTWSDLGVPYILLDDLHVNKHTTLAAGTELRFPSNSYLYVNNEGSLTAQGTAGNPIVLTGQSQTPGYWIGLEFVNSNSSDNVLEYVTIKYGGANYGGITANLYVGGTSRVTINHCTLSHGDGVGFWFSGDPNITFASNTITDNTEGAGQVEPWLVGKLTATSTYTGNDTDLLRVRGGSTTVDQTWSDLGVPYILLGDLHVNKHTTLAAGTELRFPSGTYLYVNNEGSLTAQGTAGNPIVLTGQSQTPGYWIGVEFVNSNSTDNVLEYVTIKYGGSNYGGITANLYVGGTSNVTLQNCTIRNSSGWGIWEAGGATLTQSGTSFSSNASGNEH